MKPVPARTHAGLLGHAEPSPRIARQEEPRRSASQRLRVTIVVGPAVSTAWLHVGAGQCGKPLALRTRRDCACCPRETIHFLLSSGSSSNDDAIWRNLQMFRSIHIANFVTTNVTPDESSGAGIKSRRECQASHEDIIANTNRCYEVEGLKLMAPHRS